MNTVKSQILNSDLDGIEINCLKVLSPPIFSIPTGTYASTQFLNITAPTSPVGITVRYRNDGTNPTCSDSIPPSPVTISTSQTIYAISCLASWVPSSISGGTYSIGSVLKIWVSNATTNGNLNGTGGSVGGDAICNNAGDANHPGSGTYKALIWTSSRTPISADWPLLALTNYYRTDGTTLIGATDNQKIFSASLSNPINGTTYKVWTGIKANTNPWTIGTDHCVNFTSGILSNDGVYGSSDQTAPGDAFGRPGAPNRDACNQSNHLYCVQQ